MYFIVERPAIDWLTLTTYDVRLALECADLIHHLTGIGEDSLIDMTIDSYVGKKGDGFFVGEREQNGKPHHMISLYGWLADRFMFHALLPRNMRCTRIDVQITLSWEYSHPNKWFVDSMDILEAHEQTKAQRARKIKPILDPRDGFCTMYVGAKSSKKFYRIYIKGDAPNDLYIRFEVSYKGKRHYAQKAYDAILDNPASMTEHLAHEIRTMPKDAPIVKPFHEYVRRITGKPLPSGRERSTPEKTLNWIVKQVMPAFQRVLGNDETHFTAMLILQELNDFVNRLDK